MAKKKTNVRKLSWFQYVILFYMSFLGVASTVHNDILNGFSSGGIAGMLGTFVGFLAIYYLIMYAYNRFVHPKIQVKNENLIKTWQIIRILITSLIGLWFIIGILGLFSSI